ncbi:MAG: hypothetical protein JJE04_00050 [Acidobacteriia bacterium]|nr:hypothetical protein [Terriglobia bacterium]
MFLVQNRVPFTVRHYGGNPAPAGPYRLAVTRDGFSPQNPDRLTALSESDWYEL